MGFLVQYRSIACGATVACGLLVMSPALAEDSITDKLGGWLFGRSPPPAGSNNPAGPAA
jgi:hypothetical protein